MNLKHVSVFAGIGGLDYGLQGISECVGISEVKESSIEIFRKNLGDVMNYGDITLLNPKKLPDFDLLIGGFPCQSFSLAGLRKGFEDKKGKMIFYIYDILKEKQPKYVVLENVKGIVNHNDGKTVRDVIKLLSNLGYFVRVVLINSLHHGSAQNRERVFFLGCKEDFPHKFPVIKDDTKRFRDIRELNVPYKFVKKTDKNIDKINQKGDFKFELIGGYDRVGTLTTQEGCGEKLVYEEKEEDYRLLTELECERLQNFPDGWTEGISRSNRFFALGNAVNCAASEYLFKDYLKGVWWK